MIKKSLLIELVAMIALFIGLDAFIFIKKDNIKLLMVMIFFEFFVLGLLTLCVAVDNREKDTKDKANDANKIRRACR